MDDLLKNLTIGFFSFLVIHGSLEPRVRRSAERQVSESFGYTGKVRAHVEPRGMLGMYVNDFWSVDIYGSGIRTDRLPFTLVPRSGWKGSIRHLRMHLSDFILAGLPIEKFDVDVPFVKYDIGHAVYKSRLLVRRAGEGPAVVQVGSSGLRTFLLRKYPETFKEIQVSFGRGRVSLSGSIALFGDPSPFTASGTLKPRLGRYVDLMEPEVEIGGLRLNPANAASLMRRLNPVLDIETDLPLKGFFTLKDVVIGNSNIILRGNMTVPPATTFPPAPGKK